MSAQLARIAARIWTGDLEQARSLLRDFEARFNYPLLSVTFAVTTGDIAALEKHLERAPPGWSKFHPIYAALVPYLAGDRPRARAMVAPLHDVEGYQPYQLQMAIALIEGDLDAAFDYYYKSINAAEPSGIQSIQGRPDFRRAFPEFYGDPRYTKLLKDFGLDKKSVAEMSLEELPF